MTRPEIIGSERSSYTRVVRMVCEEKGIGYELTETLLGAAELRHGIAQCQQRDGRSGTVA